MFMRRLMYLFATDDVGGAAPAEADSAIDQPTPGGESTEEQINWEKRAADNQAWATKAAQEAADLRQWQEKVKNDPEAQAEFLRELGYDLQEEATQFEDDPVAALQAKITSLEEQWQTQQQTAAQQAEMAQAMQAGEAHVANELAALDRPDIEEPDQAWIISRALSLPPDQSGMPDIKAAYKEFVAFEERQAKKRARPNPTHRVSAQGGAGESVPDRQTHDGRVAHMLTQLQDAAG